jgi:hypothetical protein
MGFGVQIATEALESCEYPFSRALLFLLHGKDLDKAKFMGAHHLRRHTRRNTASLDTAKAAGSNVRADYVHRAQQHFHRDMQVVDFGMYAGETTNACFGLCLVAGLSRTPWRPEAHALPGLMEMAELWNKVRALDLLSLDKAAAVRQSPLGLLAEKLRNYMCDGPDAVLLRQDMLEKLYPAYAAIDTRSERRQLHHYKQWVQRVAKKEFADDW